MSLTTIHPVWSMCETSFEVGKATTVANMLSGRYVTDHRARHWSKVNPEGNCQLCLVSGSPKTPGTLEHLLISCPALSDTRLGAISHWSNYMVDKPFLLPIVSHYTISAGNGETTPSMNFLLDPSTCPRVISSAQELGSAILSHICYMTRTWCHTHHIRRKRILKFYNII